MLSSGWEKSSANWRIHQTSYQRNGIFRVKTQIASYICKVRSWLIQKSSEFDLCVNVFTIQGYLNEQFSVPSMIFAKYGLSIHVRCSVTAKTLANDEVIWIKKLTLEKIVPNPVKCSSAMKSIVVHGTYFRCFHKTNSTVFTILSTIESATLHLSSNIFVKISLFECYLFHLKSDGEVKSDKDNEHSYVGFMEIYKIRAVHNILFDGRGTFDRI